MRLSVADIRALHNIEESQQLDPELLLGKSSDQVKFTRPLQVDVQAQMTHTNIVVTGKVSTHGQFICARCLTEFEAPLNGNFQDVFSFDQDSIDLTDLIRESIWVDVPLRGLCKEGCLGLCPNCGINKNISKCNCEVKNSDAQWSALREFRLK